jgi:hypothetical protein
LENFNLTLIQKYNRGEVESQVLNPGLLE